MGVRAYTQNKKEGKIKRFRDRVHQNTGLPDDAFQMCPHDPKEIGSFRFTLVA